MDEEVLDMRVEIVLDVIKRIVSKAEAAEVLGCSSNYSSVSQKVL